MGRRRLPGRVTVIPAPGGEPLELAHESVELLAPDLLERAKERGLVLAQ
jgi:hypothetical protein